MRTDLHILQSNFSRKIEAIFDDPAASNTLKEWLRAGINLDPADAYSDAQVLLELLGERSRIVESTGSHSKQTRLGGI